MKSKAAQIRQWLAFENAPNIARRVGVALEYVRVVRQRTSRTGKPTLSAAEAAWMTANPEKQREIWRNKVRRSRRVLVPVALRSQSAVNGE
jgi:hypothetical protein